MRVHVQALRNDYCHAFVLWFDVGFTQGHKEIWLSTSPRQRSTHWRQTVVYMHDELCTCVCVWGGVVWSA
jgi:protein arginine N-methyltransferase 1